MILFQSSNPLSWGHLDLPLFGLDSDWFGQPLQPPAMFSIASDPKYLWFIASRQAPALTHPSAKPNQFTPDLWKYDCSELFFSCPQSGHYLEFNLAPNSAWWASEFSSPRVPATNQPPFSNHIQTWQDTTGHSWITAMAIELDFLKANIGFSAASKINATFILNSPQQIFISAAKLPGQNPDYHQPHHFERIFFKAI
jgi:hypothetical protein